MVGVVTAVTSAIIGAVVSVVVVLSVVVVSSVVVDSSFTSLQEIMVKLKRNRERMMSICLTWFLISGLGEPNIYHDLGVFYKNVGIYLEVCLTVKKL